MNEMDSVGQITDFMSNDVKNRVAGIVSEAGQRLMRFIRVRVANEADAEDILQDVWRQLVTTLEEGPIERVGAWLDTVARNRIINQYRKPKMPSLDAMTAEFELDDEAFELPESLLHKAATPEGEDL